MPAWIDVAFRSFLFLVTLFFLTKWLGKQQIAQLSIFEYISGIVLGGIVAMHSFDRSLPISHGLIAMSIWFIIPFAVEFFSLKSKALRDFVQGKSTILIQDGKVLEDNLKKEKLTADDLLHQLRKNHIFRVTDVEFALLEPSGTVSVLPKKENQPLTPKTLGIKVAPEKEVETVIIDGEIQLESLANIALNPYWLETELTKLNVTLENVFLAQADTDGQLTIDVYDDKMTIPEPVEKPLLLATMKKCQADLELFALATDNPKSKTLYQKNSEKLQQAIEHIQPYLL